MRGRRFTRAGTSRRPPRRALGLAGALAVVLACVGCGSMPPPAEVPIVFPATGPTVDSPATPGPGGGSTTGAPDRGPEVGAPNPGTGETGSSGGSGETADGGHGSPPSPDVSTSERLAQARRDALRNGLIAYRPPSPMRQGSVQRVVVRASGIEQRGRLLAGFPDASGQVVTTPLDVGLTLSADLAGEGFVVTPIGTGDPFRPSLASDVAEWQWDIKPTGSGPRTLTLVVRSYYGDLTAPVALRYVNAPVLVSWDPWFSVTQVVSSPSWAATGLTVPVLLGAAVAARRRRRRRSAAESAGAPVPAPARSPADDRDRGYL